MAVWLIGWWLVGWLFGWWAGWLDYAKTTVRNFTKLESETFGVDPEKRMGNHISLSLSLTLCDVEKGGLLNCLQLSKQVTTRICLLSFWLIPWLHFA